MECEERRSWDERGEDTLVEAVACDGSSQPSVNRVACYSSPWRTSLKASASLVGCSSPTV